MLINSYRCCIVISRLLNLIKVKQLGFAPPAVIISSTCHFLISVPLWMNTKLWWSNLRCIRKCCEHETTVVAAYVGRFIFRFSLRFRIIHPSARPSVRLCVQIESKRNLVFPFFRCCCLVLIMLAEYFSSGVELQLDRFGRHRPVVADVD